jgi:hypothetical protein
VDCRINKAVLRLKINLRHPLLDLSPGALSATPTITVFFFFFFFCAPGIWDWHEDPHRHALQVLQVPEWCVFFF